MYETWPHGETKRTESNNNTKRNDEETSKMRLNPTQATEQTKFGLGRELIFKLRIQIGRTNETSYFRLTQGSTESTLRTKYWHINFGFNLFDLR